MCSCSLPVLPLIFEFGVDISWLTPSRKHPSLHIGMLVLGCGDLHGGFTVTKVSCVFCQRYQYLKEDTWKSYSIILVQRGTCNVMWAKPVALQRRGLWFPVTHIAPMTVPEPRRAMAAASSWWFDGDVDLPCLILKNYPFFNVTMLLHIKRAVFVL